MRLFLLIITSCCFLFSFSQNVDLEIPYCSALPLVDGIVDENDPWTDDWIPMERGNTSALTTLSAEFQVLHNHEFLSLAVQVHDTTVFEKYPDISSNDHIQVVLVMDTTFTGYCFDNVGAWYVSYMRMDTSEMECYVTNPPVWNGYPMLYEGGFEEAFLDDGTDYTVEFKIPLAELAYNIDSFDFEYIRFDVGVNDIFDYTDGWYTAQDIHWFMDLFPNTCRGEFYGIARLMEEVVSVPQMKDNQFAVYQDGNRLQLRNARHPVSIYDLKGNVLKSAINVENGSIPLHDLGPGVYIAKCGNASVKFVRPSTE